MIDPNDQHPFEKWEDDLIQTIESLAPSEEILNEFQKNLSDIINTSKLLPPIDEFTNQFLTVFCPQIITKILSMRPSPEKAQILNSFLEAIIPLYANQLITNNPPKEFINSAKNIIYDEKSQFYRFTCKPGNPTSEYYQENVKTFVNCGILADSLDYIQNNSQAPIETIMTLISHFYNFRSFCEQDNLTAFFQVISQEFQKRIQIIEDKDIRSINEKQIVQSSDCIHQILTNPKYSNDLIKLDRAMFLLAIRFAKSQFLNKQITGLSTIRLQLTNSQSESEQYQIFIPKEKSKRSAKREKRASENYSSKSRKSDIDDSFNESENINEIKPTQLNLCQILDEEQLIPIILHNNPHPALVPEFSSIFKIMLHHNFITGTELHELWTITINQHQTTINTYLKSIEEIRNGLTDKLTKKMWKIFSKSEKFPIPVLLFFQKIANKGSNTQRIDLYNSLMSEYNKLEKSNDLTTQNALIETMCALVPENPDTCAELQTQSFEMMKNATGQNLLFSMALFKASCKCITPTKAHSTFTQLLPIMKKLPDELIISFLDMIELLITRFDEEFTDEEFEELVKSTLKVVVKNQDRIMKFYTTLFNAQYTYLEKNSMGKRNFTKSEMFYSDDDDADSEGSESETEDKDDESYDESYEENEKIEVIKNANQLATKNKKKSHNHLGLDPRHNLSSSTLINTSKGLYLLKKACEIDPPVIDFVFFLFEQINRRNFRFLNSFPYNSSYSSIFLTSTAMMSPSAGYMSEKCVKSAESLAGIDLIWDMNFKYEKGAPIPLYLCTIYIASQDSNDVKCYLKRCMKHTDKFSTFVAIKLLMDSIEFQYDNVSRNIEAIKFYTRLDSYQINLIGLYKGTIRFPKKYYFEAFYERLAFLSKLKKNEISAYLVKNNELILLTKDNYELLIDDNVTIEIKQSGNRSTAEKEAKSIYFPSIFLSKKKHFDKLFQYIKNQSDDQELSRIALDIVIRLSPYPEEIEIICNETEHRPNWKRIFALRKHHWCLFLYRLHFIGALLDKRGEWGDTFYMSGGALWLLNILFTDALPFFKSDEDLQLILEVATRLLQSIEDKKLKKKMITSLGKEIAEHIVRLALHKKKSMILLDTLFKIIFEFADVVPTAFIYIKSFTTLFNFSIFNPNPEIRASIAKAVKLISPIKLLKVILKQLPNSNNKYCTEYFEMLDSIAASNYPHLMKKMTDTLLAKYELNEDMQIIDQLALVPPKDVFTQGFFKVYEKVVTKENDPDSTEQVVFEFLVNNILFNKLKYINPTSSIFNVMTHFLSEDPELANLIIPKIQIKEDKSKEIKTPLTVCSFKKHRGIVNLGATCYLNATIQVLYNIPYFRHLILQKYTNRDVNKIKKKYSKDNASEDDDYEDDSYESNEEEAKNEYEYEYEYDYEEDLDIPSQVQETTDPQPKENNSNQNQENQSQVNQQNEVQNDPIQNETDEYDILHRYTSDQPEENYMDYTEEPGMPILYANDDSGTFTDDPQDAQIGTEQPDLNNNDQNKNKNNDKNEIENLPKRKKIRKRVKRKNDQLKLINQHNLNDPASFPNWLQKFRFIFAKLLLFPTEYIDITDFVKTFTWYDEPINTHAQQDAVEFVQMFLNHLNENLPNATKLFQGEICHETVGTDVPYKSVCTEKFFVFPLEVNGHKSVEESFRTFLLPDVFRGQDQYETEEMGKIDAKRFHWISKAPKILILQLKRFTFDVKTGDRAKLNNEYYFPKILDLKTIMRIDQNETKPKEEEDKIEEEESDSESTNEPKNDSKLYLTKKESIQDIKTQEIVQNDEKYIYDLIAVEMHSGDVSGGHYYSFCGTPSNNNWYKYDDTNTTKIDSDDLPDIALGGKTKINGFNPKTNMNEEMEVDNKDNAYLLYYQLRDAFLDIETESESDEEHQNFDTEIEEEEEDVVETKRVTGVGDSTTDVSDSTTDASSQAGNTMKLQLNPNSNKSRRSDSISNKSERSVSSMTVNVNVHYNNRKSMIDRSFQQYKDDIDEIIISEVKNKIEMFNRSLILKNDKYSQFLMSIADTSPDMEFVYDFLLSALQNPKSTEGIIRIFDKLNAIMNENIAVRFLDETTLIYNNYLSRQDNRQIRKICSDTVIAAIDKSNNNFETYFQFVEKFLPVSINSWTDFDEFLYPLAYIISNKRKLVNFEKWAKILTNFLKNILGKSDNNQIYSLIKLDSLYNCLDLIFEDSSVRNQFESTYLSINFLKPLFMSRCNSKSLARVLRRFLFVPESTRELDPEKTTHFISILENYIDEEENMQTICGIFATFLCIYDTNSNDTTPKKVIDNDNENDEMSLDDLDDQDVLQKDELISASNNRIVYHILSLLSEIDYSENETFLCDLILRIPYIQHKLIPFLTDNTRFWIINWLLSVSVNIRNACCELNYKVFNKFPPLTFIDANFDADEAMDEPEASKKSLKKIATGLYTLTKKFVEFTVLRMKNRSKLNSKGVDTFRMLPYRNFYELLKWSIVRTDSASIVLRQPKLIVRGMVKFKKHEPVNSDLCFATLKFIHSVIGVKHSKQFFRKRSFARKFVQVFSNATFDSVNRYTSIETVSMIVSLLPSRYSKYLFNTHFFKTSLQYCFSAISVTAPQLETYIIANAKLKRFAPHFWSDQPFNRNYNDSNYYLSLTAAILSNQPELSNYFFEIGRPSQILDSLIHNNKKQDNNEDEIVVELENTNDETNDTTENQIVEVENNETVIEFSDVAAKQLEVLVAFLRAYQQYGKRPRSLHTLMLTNLPDIEKMLQQTQGENGQQVRADVLLAVYKMLMQLFVMAPEFERTVLSYVENGLLAYARDDVSSGAIELVRFICVLLNSNQKESTAYQFAKNELLSLKKPYNFRIVAELCDIITTPLFLYEPPVDEIVEFLDGLRKSYEMPKPIPKEIKKLILTLRDKEAKGITKLVELALSDEYN